MFVTLSPQIHMTRPAQKCDVLGGRAYRLDETRSQAGASIRKQSQSKNKGHIAFSVHHVMI